jgi:acetyl-CoA C-acetyltransferase
MSEAFIVSAARTAGGRRNGRLARWHPADLAGQVIDALLDRSGIDPLAIEDVIMGCVTQAGQQSSNVARWSVLSSRLPESVPGVTIDRQCGSSQQALHFAAATVMSGTMDCVIAGGIESMSRVPMGLASLHLEEAGFGNHKSSRNEARYPEIIFNQFDGAEAIARKHGFDRETLDRYGFESHRKAIAATRNGNFDAEIVPVEIRSADGEADLHRIDEGIRFDVALDGMAAMKTLQEGGRLTAATSSQICDGASAVLIVNERGLKALGLNPIARVHQMLVTGGDPVVMLEEPLFATAKALERAGMKIGDIDLYEVNEAFASVPLAWLRHLEADPDRLNVNGGAIALGHPLGATGTRLMTTMIHSLERRNGRFGLQAMCEGGGLANVTIVERL